jgi:hypothetical protein
MTSDDMDIFPCKKCGYKQITLTGMIHLDADDEPYIAGQREDVEFTIDEAVHAIYCEQCETFNMIGFAERMGVFAPEPTPTT